MTQSNTLETSKLGHVTDAELMYELFDRHKEVVIIVDKIKGEGFWHLCKTISCSETGILNKDEFITLMDHTKNEVLMRGNFND
jgi:hypothetical protein